MLKKIKKHEKVYRTDKSGKLVLDAEIKYDREEKIIWEQHLFPSGEIQSESEFEYEDDRIIREKAWNELGEWTEIKYLYNEKNQLVYRTSINSDGDKEVFETKFEEDRDITRTYDSEGNLYQEEIASYNLGGQDVKRQFFEEGKLIQEHEYYYDINGNMSYKILRFENDFGELQESKISYEYDSNKNIILEVETDVKGNILNSLKSIYKNDFIVEEIENDFEGSYEVLITKYEYDRQDRLIKLTVSNKDGKSRFQNLYAYNEDGSIVDQHIMAESQSFDRPPEKKQFRRLIEFY